MSIVIPRSTWGPRHDNGVAIIGVQEWLNAGKELWLHHSITNPFGPDATLEQDCQHMRDFESIGENRFGAGISYTWVVMPSGRVFQGHDIDRQGTHTYQRNNKSRGICLAGNYDVTALPARMRVAVAALLRELGASLDGGHRDVYPTACPGRYAYDQIGEINRLASSGEPLIPGGDDLSWNDTFKDPDTGQEHPAWAWLVYANKKAEWAANAVQALLSTPIPSPLPQDVDAAGNQREYRLVDWIVYGNLKADRAANASEAALKELGGIVPGDIEVSKDVVDQALQDFFSRAMPAKPEMPTDEEATR